VIDLHCHLHPGVDDGPMEPAHTIALAHALLKVGVTKVACTSHVRPDKEWMNTKEGVAERHAKLDEILDGIPLERVQGAEHYIDDRVFGDLDKLADIAVPYGSSRWLLVEVPYLGERLLELLHGVRRKGFRVLLAHVERFPYLCDHDDKLQRLVDAGHRIQVNIGSLAGAYNRAQQKGAERLLKLGVVSVLAGDCHRDVDVKDNIEKGLPIARKLIGEAGVKKLFVENPARILADDPPERLL
jgi:protein-tyrosine phosphatase